MGWLAQVLYWWLGTLTSSRGGVCAPFQEFPAPNDETHCQVMSNTQLSEHYKVLPAGKTYSKVGPHLLELVSLPTAPADAPADAPAWVTSHGQQANLGGKWLGKCQPCLQYVLVSLLYLVVAVTSFSGFK